MTTPFSAPVFRLETSPIKKGWLGSADGSKPATSSIRLSSMLRHSSKLTCMSFKYMGFWP
jgi:hypothetical protein